jgi:hypothetical protein
LGLFGDILALNERCSWIEEEKGKLPFQHFGREMKREPLRKWNKLTKIELTHDLEHQASQKKPGRNNDKPEPNDYEQFLGDDESRNSAATSTGPTY